MPTGAQRHEAALARLAAEGGGAFSVADAACGIWGELTTALSPIIGQRGVSALYQRSLQSTRIQHPVLPSEGHDDMASNAAALKAALSATTGPMASAAAGALLSHFCELLSSLIGPSLADRLLRPVWAHLPGEPPVQDSAS